MILFDEIQFDFDWLRLHFSKESIFRIMNFHLIFRCMLKNKAVYLLTNRKTTIRQTGAMRKPWNISQLTNSGNEKLVKTFTITFFNEK